MGCATDQSCDSAPPAAQGWSWSGGVKEFACIVPKCVSTTSRRKAVFSIENHKVLRCSLN